MMTPTRRGKLLCGLGLSAVLAGASATAARSSTGLVPVAPVVATTTRVVRQLPRPHRVERPANLGRFQLTYYWMAREKTHRAARAAGADASVELTTKHCKPIATVSPAFARSLRLEGSGVLGDGRVITTAGGCRCGGPCYRVARRSHRFGTGVAERPLSPFRSVAVDPALVAIGQALYIPELDGMTMPGRAPWGGFVHDGCVVADDRGGGIRGKQLDLFTVRRSHYHALSRRLGQKQVTVLDGRARCGATAARRAPAVSRRGGV